MPFILSNEFIEKLHSLRKNYQIKSGVNLQDPQQPDRIHCFFGAKDIGVRRNQILFLEKWLLVLKKDLLSESTPIVSTKKYLRALSILVSASLYIQSQVEKTYKLRSSSAAILVHLFNNALGINPNNLLDNQTQSYCLNTTRHYLSKEGRWDRLNSSLDSPFTQKQWDDFLNFLDKQQTLLGSQSKYPITQFITPIIAIPVQTLAETTGYIVGEIMGKSLGSLDAKYLLLAAAGSGVMLTVNSISAQTTFFLLAPFAERLLSTLSGVSTAWVFSKTGQLVGKGLGMGIGLPLDLGWKLISECRSSLLHSKTNQSQSSEEINGISLIKKSRFVDGCEFSLVHVDKLINDIDTLAREIAVPPTPWQIQFNPN